jgi:hypothetical protein
MRTRKAGEMVKGGFYFNTKAWDIHLVRTAGTTLPGGENDRYIRIPALALLVIGPLMGFAFVIFLPLAGFALTFREAGRRIAGLFGRRAHEPKLAAK